MGKIRTFIAIELPDSHKLDVDKLIVGLKLFGPDVRWVRAGNLHFTLRFLGDVEQSDIPKLKDQLKANLASVKPFSLKLAGLGCFPNMKRPRIVWLGAEGEMDTLSTLAGQVESACQSIGLGKADKPFSPHLTIGRINEPRGLEKLIEKLEKMQYESAEFTVDQIVIFKSDLTPRGPIYTSIAKVKLGS